MSLTFNFYRGKVERSIFFFFCKLSNFKFQNWNDSKRIIIKQKKLWSQRWTVVSKFPLASMILSSVFGQEDPYLPQMVVCLVSHRSINSTILILIIILISTVFSGPSKFLWHFVVRVYGFKRTFHPTIYCTLQRIKIEW